MNIKFYAKWAVSTLLGSLHENSYCAEWDAALNRLMDEHGEDAELERGGYTLRLGKYRVWVENAYYAYGHLHGHGACTESRPSLSTMARLDLIVQRLDHARIEADRRAQREKMAAIGMEASK